MPNTAPVSQGIGVSVPRIEDEALLTGSSRFIDDIDLAGQAHAHFVRSPYAHARINASDCVGALAAPRVIAVFTGADMVADGVGEILGNAPVENRNGAPLFVPPRRAMATNVARYAGETVAVVIAKVVQQVGRQRQQHESPWDPLRKVQSTEGDNSVRAVVGQPHRRVLRNESWASDPTGDERAA